MAVRLPSFHPRTDQFYFCRMCKTHIARVKDLVTHSAEGFELVDPYFIDGMNVRILHPSDRRRTFGDEVVNVYCMGCKSLLGKQNFVKRDGKPIVCNCMLYLKTLMRWDGKKIIDGAETAEYLNWCKNNPEDFSIGPWFADLPAGHVCWDAYVRVERFHKSIHQFICRVCGIEIAEAKDYLTRHEGVHPREPVFGNIINVHTASAVVEHIVGGYRAIRRSVHCNKCGSLLGKHYLELPRADGEPSGRAYIPDLTKFYYWDGQKLFDGAAVLEH